MRIPRSGVCLIETAVQRKAREYAAQSRRRMAARDPHRDAISAHASLDGVDATARRPDVNALRVAILKAVLVRNFGKRKGGSRVARPGQQG